MIKKEEFIFTSNIYLNVGSNIKSNDEERARLICDNKK